MSTPFHLMKSEEFTYCGLPALEAQRTRERRRSTCPDCLTLSEVPVRDLATRLYTFLLMHGVSLPVEPNLAIKTWQTSTPQATLARQDGHWVVLLGQGSLVVLTIRATGDAPFAARVAGLCLEFGMELGG